MHTSRHICALLISVAAFALSVPTTKAEENPNSAASVESQPIADGFTFAATGDLIYLRPMLPTLEKQSPDMIAILRGASAAFGNFETSSFDLAEFRGYPEAESGGSWLLADKRVPADLVAMGFDLVSRANNHATDWGVQGMLQTSKTLDDAGLRYAGVGPNLSSAVAPRYLDLPGGRIGLVAGTSTFRNISRAADPFGEVPGRPGTNAIRTKRTVFVHAKNLDALASVAKTKPGEPVVLEGVTYRVAPTSELVDQASYTINSEDERINLRAVRQAKQNANLAVYSFHNHEPGNWSETPGDFAVNFAHSVIDAGADMFIGHGPHQLRGIEIYKGKPIFYSLGDFSIMNSSLDFVPPDFLDRFSVDLGDATVPEMLRALNAKRFAAEGTYESAIAVTRFEKGQAAEIKLYPLNLSATDRGVGRGVPRLAMGSQAVEILERLQRLSAPFGTKIEIRQGIGIIQLNADAKTR